MKIGGGKLEKNEILEIERKKKGRENGGKG